MIPVSISRHTRHNVCLKILYHSLRYVVFYVMFSFIIRVVTFLADKGRCFMCAAVMISNMLEVVIAALSQASSLHCHVISASFRDLHCPHYPCTIRSSIWP